MSSSSSNQYCAGMKVMQEKVMHLLHIPEMIENVLLGVLAAKGRTRSSQVAACRLD